MQAGRHAAEGVFETAAHAISVAYACTHMHAQSIPQAFSFRFFLFRSFCFALAASLFRVSAGNSKIDHTVADTSLPLESAALAAISAAHLACESFSCMHRKGGGYRQKAVKPWPSVTEMHPSFHRCNLWLGLGAVDTGKLLCLVSLAGTLYDRMRLYA